MTFRSLHPALPLLLAALLAGCNATSVLGTPSARAGQPLGALAVSKDAEAVPSEAELALLEQRSPDELIENAPAEPGVKLQGLWPQPPKEDLGNLGHVEDTLWRGARPTDKGLAQLQGEMGIRTIVSFENDKKVVEHEKAWAEAHGVKFYSIAMSVITPPKQAKVDEWLKIAEDPANRPLYFHCMQGRDRTGVAGLTYRIHHDHQPFATAYTEMKQFKFHTYLLGLQWYIRHYAKQSGQKVDE